MPNSAGNMKVIKAILSNPHIIKAKPSVNMFLCNYLMKFNIKEVDGNLILHSHLPALNSKPYSRFIKEHLLKKSSGPSHAQIGITNACPQDCAYCYNKNRRGRVVNKATIIQTIKDLKDIGVFWIGLTGGEPLLNKSLVEIIETIGDDCSSKLFTTGCTLTKQLAMDLKNAGLFSVSVSLDHWNEAEHDNMRRYKGAFRQALEAIDIFKNIGGIQVGVSAVLSKEMLNLDLIEKYMEFLEGLGIHEAWLNEAKPSTAEYWDKGKVINEEERKMLIEFQDRYNQQSRMTVNYLGHFEDARHFGCSAGHKMVYVDAFGEVSPCVFIPMTFGNVQDKSVKEIYHEMRQQFPTENICFMNKNFKKLQDWSGNKMIIGKEESLKIMEEIDFGALPTFFQLHYK